MDEPDAVAVAQGDDVRPDARNLDLHAVAGRAGYGQRRHAVDRRLHLVLKRARRVGGTEGEEDVILAAGMPGLRGDRARRADHDAGQRIRRAWRSRAEARAHLDVRGDHEVARYRLERQLPSVVGVPGAGVRHHEQPSGPRGVDVELLELIGVPALDDLHPLPSREGRGVVELVRQR